MSQTHPHRLVLENVRIFDATGREPVGKGVIVIEGKYIRGVGSRGSVEVPDDAEVIDCGGKMALPGLIDAHLHITGMKTGDFVKEPLITPMGVFFARAVRDLQNLLDAGFTTVVDAGGVIALHIKQAVEEGTIPGPRVVAAGYVLSQTFGHGDTHYLPVEYVDARTAKKLTPMMSLICDGVDECRKAARYALREGADFIKIMATGGVMSEKDRPEYRQFTVDEIRAIVDEARAAGRFVHAHAQGKEGIMNAVGAGVKVIAHAIYIDEDSAELAKEKDAVIVPTLSIVHKVLEVGAEAGIPEWGLKKAEEVYQEHVDNVRRVSRLGIKLATGTDFIGGPFRHGENALELKLFVEKLGLSPAEALISATRIASEAAGLKDVVGTLEEGKVADIIVVDGDPLSNIDTLLNTENVVLVVKEGRVLKQTLK